MHTMQNRQLQVMIDLMDSSSDGGWKGGNSLFLLGQIHTYICTHWHLGTRFMLLCEHQAVRGCTSNSFDCKIISRRKESGYIVYITYGNSSIANSFEIRKS